MSDDERPSWIPAPTPRTASAATEPAPITLRMAVVVTAVLVAIEVVQVAGRDDLVVGFRTFLVLMIAVQVPLAVLAARRSAGAALALLVYQVTTVLAAVAGGFGDWRGVLAACVLVVIALVVRSLGAFPTPELPRLDP